MAKHKLSTFRVDGELFGVEAAQVQEVSRHLALTAVPLAPPAVAGENGMNVVLRTEGSPVSLLVDEIESVEDVEDADFEPLPDTVTGPAREFLDGAYKLPGELLLTVDVARVLDPRPA